ncbi:MAG: hypothetical protein J6D27_09510, partial [Ruminiclostridium sp.]|nr:hypothetical protein [Ruminiclostridium sp.]
ADCTNSYLYPYKLKKPLFFGFVVMPFYLPKNILFFSEKGLTNSNRFDEHHTWCTFSRSYPTLRTFWSLFRRKDSAFVLDKCGIFSMKFALTGK